MAPLWLPPVFRLHLLPILKCPMAFDSACFRALAITPDSFLPSTFALPLPGNLQTHLILQDLAKVPSSV